MAACWLSHTAVTATAGLLVRGCANACLHKHERLSHTFTTAKHVSTVLWCVAGIVTGSEAALCSAVVKALELQPRCVQFYIDRCDRSNRPGWMDAEEGGEGPRSYLVCHKLLHR